MSNFMILAKVSQCSASYVAAILGPVMTKLVSSKRCEFSSLSAWLIGCWQRACGEHGELGRLTFCIENFYCFLLVLGFQVLGKLRGAFVRELTEIVVDTGSIRGVSGDVFGALLGNGASQLGPRDTRLAEGGWRQASSSRVEMSIGSVCCGGGVGGGWGRGQWIGRRGSLRPSKTVEAGRMARR